MDQPTSSKQAKIDVFVAPECDAHTLGSKVSKVVHVSGLASVQKTVPEAELITFLSTFGPISLSQPLSANCSYIEFESIHSAQKCIQRVQMSRDGTLPIDEETRIWVTYALRDELPRIGLETVARSNVLSISVRGGTLPVYTDLIYALLTSHVSPPAPPNRISIRNRQLPVVYVEFPDVVTALRVRGQLQGVEMFRGICKLRVEYAAFSDPATLYNQLGEHWVAPIPDGSGVQFGFSVLLVHGIPLNETIDCDALFNLCCLYGNVMKVKILASNPDMGYVQMGDPVAAQRVLMNLNGLKLMENTLDFVHTRIAFIDDEHTSPPLRNEQPSVKSFENDQRNRFLTLENVMRARIIEPGPILYAFGMRGVSVPTSENLLHMVFDCNSVQRPEEIHLVAAKSANKTAVPTAIFCFADVHLAVNALCLLNHIKVAIPGERPFMLRLSFCAPDLIKNVMSNQSESSGATLAENFQSYTAATPTSDHSSLR